MKYRTTHMQFEKKQMKSVCIFGSLTIHRYFVSCAQFAPTFEFLAHFSKFLKNQSFAVYTRFSSNRIEERKKVETMRSKFLDLKKFIPKIRQIQCLPTMNSNAQNWSSSPGGVHDSNTVQRKS